jgi:hypothetical protein
LIGSKIIWIVVKKEYKDEFFLKKNSETRIKE